MNVYILTQTYEDEAPEIVAIYDRPAKALKAMKDMAQASFHVTYRQLSTPDERFPWWESNRDVLEVDQYPLY